MKVVDASVIVELVANDLDPDRLGDEELAVPHLIDSEVTNVLRRLVAHKVLSDKQGTTALDGFTHLALTRFPADWEPLKSAWIVSSACSTVARSAR